MNVRSAPHTIAIFAALLFVPSLQGNSQAPVQASSLASTITAQDKALFAAYNTCDLKTLGSMVTDDLEFYHDKTGLAIGKQTFLESIRENICGKVTRELVSGSLEIYPLAGYGAVEIGTHRFLHPWVQDHGVVGEGRFVMIWQNKGGVWRIARVISYDHHAAD